MFSKVWHIYRCVQEALGGCPQVPPALALHPVRGVFYIEITAVKQDPLNGSEVGKSDPIQTASLRSVL